MPNEKQRTIAIQAALNVEAVGKIPSFRLEPAYSGGKMPTLNGWDHPVVVECSGVSAAQKLPILKMHSSWMVLGHTSEITIENEIAANGKFSMIDAGYEEREEIQKIVQAAKEGYAWQASIGTDPVNDTNYEFIPDGVTTTVNGQSLAGPFYVIRSCVLREISIVVLGADPNTSVSIEASKSKGEFKMTKEITAESAEPKTVNATGQPDPITEAPKSPDVPPASPPPAPAITPAAAPQVQAESGQHVHYHLYGSDWTPEDAENQIKGKRGITATGERRRDGVDFVNQTTQNRTFPSQDGPTTGDVIEAALLMNSGISAERCEKLGIKQDTLNEAMTGGFRGFTPRQFFIMAMKQIDPAFESRNFGDISTSDFKMFMRKADEQTIEAAANLRRNSIQASSSFSTLSLPGILSNVAHKTLLDSFRSVPSVIDQIAASISVNDFKEHHSYRLTLDGDYAEVGEGGEIEDVNLVESEHRNRVRTYGAAITWTYQMFVNDDLNAMSTIGQKLGRRARQNQNKKAFELLFKMLADPTLFTAAKGNRVKWKFSIEGISDALAKFAELKDDAGQLIEMLPKYIMVPPVRNAIARTFQNSTEITIGSAKRLSPTSNPVAGLFDTISTALFGGANGGNNDHWLVLADPSECAILEAAYLKGQREPQVETFDTDPRTLGLITRSVFHFGVTQGDPRGAVYSEGTDDPPALIAVP